MLSDPAAHSGIDNGQVVIFFKLKYNRVVEDRTLIGQKGPVNTSAGRQGFFLRPHAGRQIIGKTVLKKWISDWWNRYAPSISKGLFPSKILTNKQCPITNTQYRIPNPHYPFPITHNLQQETCQQLL